MLYKYLRHNGIPVACIAAVNDGAVGFMVAHPNMKTPSKWFMREVAVGRAIKVQPTRENVAERCYNREITIDTPDGTITGPVVDIIMDAIDEMSKRSEKYYKAEALR